MFGKPVDLSSLPLPSGAQHPSFPVNAPHVSRDDQDEGLAKRGFAYLKRDLVRLLGILCSGDTNVQNRIRLAGGIPIVMNLCVVDERNPCTSHTVLVLPKCSRVPLRTNFGTKPHF
jgi:hypothetical protein